jgi:hypothetical protein
VAQAPLAQPVQVARPGVAGPVDDPQVFPAAHLEAGLDQAPGAMAARYQHVTDAMRSHVASQAGALIWAAPDSGGTGPAAVVVSSESLAAILAAVEQCISHHHGDSAPAAGVVAALADLRATLPAAPAPPATSNE